MEEKLAIALVQLLDGMGWWKHEITESSGLTEKRAQEIIDLGCEVEKKYRQEILGASK